MKPTWIEWDKSWNSTAQLPPHKRHCPSHKSCHVVCKRFWKSFNFSPGPTAESQFKFDLFYIVCNGAVWSSTSIIRARARAHCATAPVSDCIVQLPSDMSSGSQPEQARPDSDSESARPGWLGLRSRADCKTEWPSSELDCLSVPNAGLKKWSTWAASLYMGWA